MNKTIIALGLLSSSALLLTACGGESSSESPGSAPRVDGVSDTEIVIGSHNDFSGPLALIGKVTIDGVRMRLDEVNESGGVHGRKIRLVVEDTQYQVPRAIQATNKLVNRDRIFAMFLGMGTPTNNATLQMLEEKGVPNIFPISGARSMVEPFRKIQFIARGIYYDEIRAGTNYYLREDPSRVPCIIYQDTDFGQEVYEGAVDQLAEMGYEPAAVSAHKPADTEFTAAILRLRNAGCSLVMMGTVHKDTLLIFEAARKLGWTDVKWAGTNASYSQSVAELESGAAEGYSAFVHMAQVYSDDPAVPQRVRDWIDRYTERYGESPEYFAMEGYRNTDLLILALERAGPNLTREGLIDALESISEYTDLFGYRLSFGPNDHKGVKESVLSVVENGRWVTKAESVSY